MPHVPNISDYVSKTRLSERIKLDESVCREHLDRGLFLAMHKGRPLFNDEGKIAWLDRAQASGRVDGGDVEAASFVFLDWDDESGRALFAVNVSGAPESENFPELRLALFTVDDLRASSLLQRAYSLLKWHRVTRFCSRCGSASVRRTFSGHQIACRDCSAVSYPSPSPCGIVLVEAPDHSRALLIRQPRYPRGMYSCIAGFVDMGESIGECVRREVAEEAGVEVEEGSVRVVTSDHWPFPSGSLMVGCYARADPDAGPPPDPCAGEVEEAKWFAAEEVRDAFMAVCRDPGLRIRGSGGKEKGDAKMFVPPKEALAHHLIRSWLLEHGHIELKPGL